MKSEAKKVFSAVAEVHPSDPLFRLVLVTGKLFKDLLERENQTKQIPGGFIKKRKGVLK